MRDSTGSVRSSGYARGYSRDHYARGHARGGAASPQQTGPPGPPRAHFVVSPLHTGQSHLSQQTGRSVDSMPKSEPSVKSTASAVGGKLFGAIHKVQQAVNFERATARSAGEERALLSFTWREEETAAPLFGCIAGVGTCLNRRGAYCTLLLLLFACMLPLTATSAVLRVIGSPLVDKGIYIEGMNEALTSWVPVVWMGLITLVTVVCLHSLRRATSPRGLLYMLSHPSAGKPELMSAKSRKLQDIAQITAQVSDPPAPRRRTILPLSDAGFVTPMVSARLARRVKRKAVFFFFLVLAILGLGFLFLQAYDSLATLVSADGSAERAAERAAKWPEWKVACAIPFLSFLVLVASFVMWAWLVSLDIAGAVVEDELAHLAERIEQYNPVQHPEEWEHMVVCAVQHQVGESLPLLSHGFGVPLVSWVLVATTNAVAAIVISAKTASPKMRYSFLAASFSFVVLIFVLLLPVVFINRMCSRVKGKLAAKALAAMSPHEPKTLASAKVLRENLASSSKFGFSVLGVTVTSRLLAKAAATTASLFVFFVTWT